MQANLRVLLNTLLIVFALGAEFDPYYTYADFNRTYPRTYTGDEWTMHEAAFVKNYAELVKLKNEGKDVAINDLLDWTDDQIRALCNFKPLNSSVRVSSRPRLTSSLFASPTMFDWRFYGVVTPIKNQGSCGSCWAFSTAAEYQSKIAITTGALYDLSEQYIIKCQTVYSQGCDGGYPQRALQLLNRTGIPLQQDYPYNPSGPAGDICTNSAGRIRLNQTVNAVKFYSFQNLTVEQLQQDLVSYGPINVGIRGSDTNFMYAGLSGLISCGSSSTIDHAIVLVGYNSTHWFVKNSWGTSWGDNGYGYISKNTTNDCNIRQYVSEMQVSVTPPTPIPQFDQVMINATVTMTDSGSDGWNGNSISIKQNNNIIATFGSNFTSGNSSGPLYIIIKGNLTTQIFVNQLDKKSREVGFKITAPNGTVLYQRIPGNSFTANELLSEFCILGACPVTTLVTVTMFDTGSNGWESNVIAFRQNNILVGSFGDTFTSGSSSGPLFFNLISNVPTQIIVKKLGNNSKQIGFVVKASNGNSIFQRVAGTAFVADTIFAGFCPGGGCPNTLLLNITMTDSRGDGWNSNVLAIKQNSVLVGTFGSQFTTGRTTSPLMFQVQGDQEVQIVVSNYGAWTQEIGFIIRAFNGTIIYQKSNGTVFLANTIFSVFCPNGGCAPSLYTTLTINMTDSGSNGWNSNILGLRQDDKILGIFGNKFTSGASSGPVSIIVQNNIATQVVVTQLGTKTNEVKFVIKTPNGTILHQRSVGKTFELSRIFATFCPGSGCSNMLALTISMTDSGSNGWNGNFLGLKQNGSIVGTFGEAFTSGAASGPLTISVIGNLPTQVVVAQIGIRTNEVGFAIKASNGTTIHERRSRNSTFTLTTVFANFCPLGNCIDLSTYNLTIKMFDLFNDGWQGTILAIQQNGQIIGTFGETFTSGSDSPPVYITVRGALQAQIVVSQLGPSTEEIKFFVFAPNGTTIYQRINGEVFQSSKIFRTFCLSAVCQGDSPYVTLEITLTDSFGDGWNGNILAIKQNNNIMGTFGNTFNSGSSFTYPIYIVVHANITAQIVVNQLGQKTNEVGFVVRNVNGPIIYQKNSGGTFDSTRIITIFCPQNGCLNILNLTVTLSDSVGDGWNNNVLAIKQNNTIVGTFGQLFTSGSVNGPITINVFGNLNAYIVVSELGTKSEEVGFVLTAPNGTIVHQRNSGNTFNATTILSTFCPIGGCPDPNSIILSITMSDSSGDGWQGNILAVKQNNTVVGTFGGSFTSGYSSEPVQIIVQGNLDAQIVVYQLGSFSREVGFIVQAPNGTIIHQRINGNAFTASTIFITFCPLSGCYVNPNVTYYLTTYDYYGDGWEGTVLTFEQNGTALFRFTLTSGSYNSSIAISFPKFSTVSITVYILGYYTNEIAFNLRDNFGNIVFERIAGIKFYPNSLLGTFCPECLNLSPVAILPEVPKAIKASVSILENKNKETTTKLPIKSANRFYMISTFVLAPLVLTFMLTLRFAVYKLKKVSKVTPSNLQNQVLKQKANQSQSVIITRESKTEMQAESFSS